MLVSAICFCCVWGLIGCFIWSAWQALPMGVPHLRRLHQVPCDRCLYATRDYRLKCTVCPCTAFSEAAIDCLDFSQRSLPLYQSHATHYQSG